MLRNKSNRNFWAVRWIGINFHVFRCYKKELSKTVKDTLKVFDDFKTGKKVYEIMFFDM